MSIVELFEIEMKSLNSRKRTIRVLLPNDYTLSQTRYPVLYMHDGQNLFDDKTASYGKSWGIKESVEALGLPLIVVGIDNPESLGRLDEYSPFVNYSMQYHMGEYITRNVGGEGDAYGSFIVDELIPLINEKYPTLVGPDHTFIAGSSMGGLISLYIGLKYQNSFGGIAAFSSALWFAENELFRFAQQISDDGIKKIYLDTGTKESSFDEDMSKTYVRVNQSFYKALIQHFDSSKVQLVIEEGAIHNEAAWEKRFKEMISEFIR